MESFGGYATAGTSHLRFPEDLSYNTDYAGHYMMFTAMKVSGGVDTRTLKFALAEGAPTVVCLPIPQGLSAAYQNNWDQQEVGGGRAAIATKGAGLMKTVADITSKGTVTGMIGAAAGAAGKGLADMSSGLRAMASDVGGTADKANAAGAGVVNEMMGMAATAPGLGDLVSAAQFSLGFRALQQTMTSYSGPGFRSFQWQYSMKPLSAVESMNALGICNYFKTRSMPAQSDMQFTRVYNLPDCFKIQFFTGNEESPWISKVGHCVCTDVSISYGGDKFTTFAGTHAPTQIDLSLSFKELELLNRQAVANEITEGSTWPGSTYQKSAKKVEAPGASWT